MVQKEITDNKLHLQKIITSLRTKDQIIYKNQKIDQNFNNLIILNEIDDYYPCTTNGNGNCLYNAISINLYGSEEYFYIIKTCMLSIFFEYQEYFRNILPKINLNNSFEKFIELVATPDSWGDDICQIAISILLNRPLYCFSIDPNKNIPYSYEYCVNQSYSKQEALNIAFISNHFVALLPKNIDPKTPKPIENQYISKDFQIIFK